MKILTLKPGVIMGIGLSLYFLGAILPGAISAFFDADTTGWDTGSIALFGLIPLAVIGFLVLRYTGAGKGE